MQFSILMAFLSQSGRHNHRSLGKDVGVDKAEKLAKKAFQEGLNVNSHRDLSDVTSNIKSLLEGAGLKFGENVAIKLIDTAINHFINDADSRSPLSELTSSIASNATKYQKTTVHIGKPTTERVKRLINQPLVQYNKKDLVHSLKDYLEHNKRRHLILKSGFNEKGFSFLMEDTYLSVKDFINFYSSNKNLETNLLKNKSGIHDVYGAIYSTKTEIKFVNELQYHDVFLKLHLVAIKDLYNDPRQLISEITNNKLDSEIKTPKTNLRGAIDESLKTAGSEFLNRSNMPQEGKNIFKEILKNFSSFRSNESNFGKLPEDQQYSDPAILDKDNRFACSFLSSLNTNLSDSINFKDRAKIVATWNRVITPKSTWVFDLIQHFGKGLHLNYLYDVKSLNEDHPVGYVFVLEYFGDKRATVTDIKTGDKFSGYSPVSLRCEFYNQMSYLAQEFDDGDLDDIPTVYKSKRNERDFEEGSELSRYFSPDRQSYLHIPVEDIDFLIGRQPKKDPKYLLEYDLNIMPSNNLLEQIQLDYRKHGFDGYNLTEDDALFNLKKPPSEKEYEGTEGQEPDIDFDEK